MAQSVLGQAAAAYAGPSLADGALPAAGRQSGTARFRLRQSCPLSAHFPAAATPGFFCAWCFFRPRQRGKNGGFGLLGGFFQASLYSIYAGLEIYRENKKKTPGKRMFFAGRAAHGSAGPIPAVRHDFLAACHVLNGGAIALDKGLLSGVVEIVLFNLAIF